MTRTINAAKKVNEMSQVSDKKMKKNMRVLYLKKKMRNKMSEMRK